jgi:hypothetical protein
MSLFACAGLDKRLIPDAAGASSVPVLPLLPAHIYYGNESPFGTPHQLAQASRFEAPLSRYSGRGALKRKLDSAKSTFFLICFSLQVSYILNISRRRSPIAMPRPSNADAASGGGFFRES